MQNRGTLKGFMQVCGLGLWRCTPHHERGSTHNLSGNMHWLQR